MDIILESRMRLAQRFLGDLADSVTAMRTDLKRGYEAVVERTNQEAKKEQDAIDALEKARHKYYSHSRDLAHSVKENTTAETNLTKRKKEENDLRERCQASLDVYMERLTIANECRRNFLRLQYGELLRDLHRLNLDASVKMKGFLSAYHQALDDDLRLRHQQQLVIKEAVASFDPSQDMVNYIRQTSLGRRPMFVPLEFQPYEPNGSLSSDRSPTETVAELQVFERVGLLQSKGRRRYYSLCVIPSSRLVRFLCTPSIDVRIDQVLKLERGLRERKPRKDSRKKKRSDPVQIWISDESRLPKVHDSPLFYRKARPY